MTIEEARGLAAQAWCVWPNTNSVLDVGLANAFAEILKREWENAYEAAKRRGIEIMRDKALEACRDVWTWDGTAGDCRDAIAELQV